jgi:methylated-DNA-[protein]-cysteine S-methyltransferase
MESAIQAARTYAVNAIESPDSFGDLPMRLQRYFRGEPVEFGDSVNVEGATDFQRAVWDATRLIPYGQIRSYSWVAERVGKPGACRAVGNALARNPIPIVIPCHRVIASDGGLGGFTGGLDMKSRLLVLESPGSKYAPRDQG